MCMLECLACFLMKKTIETCVLCKCLNFKTRVILYIAFLATVGTAFTITYIHIDTIKPLANKAIKKAFEHCIKIIINGYKK